MAPPPRFHISMIGAREHYALPRAVHRRGELDAFYTDYWASPWVRSLGSRLPMPLKSLSQRFHRDLPRSKVWSQNTATLMRSWKRRGARGSRTALFNFYLEEGQAFGQAAANAMRSKQASGNADGIFLGFSSASLETIEYAHSVGMRTIVDQIDPARTEDAMVAEECERWPGWQSRPEPIPEAYFERLSAEWAAADQVLVNSEWSASALVAQGVPREKIIVVPLAYETSEAAEVSKVSDRSAPLRVLWLGTVNLRKGIPYLAEAAKMLEGRAIEFTIAGPPEISNEVIAGLPSNMKVLGRVSREAAARHYQEADVFVLPTLSDGFAITQLEAMAHGLPVITTAHCGEVVTDGEDGCVIPIRDAHALAEAISRLADDRGKLARMSDAARAKSRQFTLDHSYNCLMEALG